MKKKKKNYKNFLGYVSHIRFFNSTNVADVVSSHWNEVRWMCVGSYHKNIHPKKENKKKKIRKQVHQRKEKKKKKTTTEMREKPDEKKCERNILYCFSCLVCNARCEGKQKKKKIYTSVCNKMRCQALGMSFFFLYSSNRDEQTNDQQQTLKTKRIYLRCLKWNKIVERFWKLYKQN